MLIVLLITILGFFLVGKLLREATFIEKISLGYGIGLGVVSFIIFLLSLIGFKITWLLVLLLVLVGILLLKFLPKGEGKLDRFSFRNFVVLSPISIMRFLICQFLTLVVFLCFYYLKRMMVFSFIDIKMLFIFIIVVLGAFTVFVKLLKKEHKIKDSVKVLAPFVSVEAILAVLIVDYFLASFILTVYWPVYIWDALTLFDSRAKIFLDQGAAILFGGQFTLRYLTAYPFMTSIYHFIVYLFGGDNPQFIYSFFYLFLILGFYSFLKKDNSVKVALLSSFLLASTPIFFHHSTFAYTNLCFVYYFSLGFLYFYRGLEKNIKGELLVGAFLFGLLAWLRPGMELFFLANLFGFFVFCLVKKNIKPIFWFIFFYLAFSVPWHIYNRFLIQKEALDSFTVIGRIMPVFRFDIEGIKKVILGLWDLQRNSDKFGVIFYVFLLALVLFPKKAFKNIFFIFLILLNFLAWIILGYGLGIWRNFNYSWRAIFYDSMGRILMVFIPLYLFFIANNLRNFLKNEDT